jgi:hypothetical protein
MKGTALLVGLFVLTFLSLAGADETAPKTRTQTPPSEASRKGAGKNRRPPEEVIQNLELFQNLPLLKEIDLFEQMQPNDQKKKCADSSSDCVKRKPSTEMNRREESAE